jgi:hypothetical protein
VGLATLRPASADEAEGKREDTEDAGEPEQHRHKAGEGTDDAEDQGGGAEAVPRGGVVTGVPH